MHSALQPLQRWGVLRFFSIAVCWDTNEETKFCMTVVYKDSDNPDYNDNSFENNLTDVNAFVKPEYTYGKSRIDFYMEKNGEKHLLEVKGCTLEVDGIGYFPDAPTERGMKHLHELEQAQQAGYRCAVAFVIQMEGVTEVRPNISTQPEFGTALAEAKAAGVRVLFLLCRVGRDSLEIVEQREG